MTAAPDDVEAMIARLKLLERSRVPYASRCAEAKALILQLVDIHGLSAGEIARRVGEGMTRSGVIGATNRAREEAGLPARRQAPSSPPKVPFSDEDSLTILRMRDARRSAGQIARALPGRTPEEVSVHLRAILRELAESEGEEVRLPVKHPENLGAELLARYEQGVSASALAAENGLGLWSVHGLLRRARDARGRAP